MIDKRQALLKKYRTMTKEQLKRVVGDYANNLPEWSVIQGGTVVVRNCGPVRQLIWFQKMSSGSYRPTHVISTTVLSMPRMLTQLPFRPSTVPYSSHDNKFSQMLTAMEQQFRPDIRKPLDVAEVLTLCEAEARSMPDSTNNMTMLAILSAWLGRDVEALGYCERAQHCPLPTLAPMPEWEGAMRTFCRELAGAIEAGRGKALLEDATAHQ